MAELIERLKLDEEFVNNNLSDWEINAESFNSGGSMEHRLVFKKNVGFAVRLDLKEFYAKYIWSSLDDVYLEIKSFVEKKLVKASREYRKFVDKGLFIAVVNKSYGLKGLNYKKIEGTDLVAILRFKYLGGYSDVTKKVLRETGFVFEECYLKALKRIKPFFIGLDRLLTNMLPVNSEKFEDDSLYVLSNTECRYGAQVLADKTNMRDVADKLGEDYYILPSSVHELIVVGVSKYADLDELASMVRTVNAEELDEDELLSYHVYKFSKETDELSIVA